uniref:hypothetical protein n=1 Tax=Flavobacterium sp. TaxID=239 RepID=UPI004048826C
MKSILFLVITLISTLAFSQNNDDFAKRLKAINNQTIIFYNIDGVDFSSQTFSNEFSEKGLKKLYRKYSIKERDVKTKDETLKNNNLFITKSKKCCRKY